MAEGLSKVVPMLGGQLIEHVTDGILTVDAQDLILDASLSACALLGLTETELVGQPFTSVVTSSDVGPLSASRRDADVITLEGMARHRDGTPIPVECFAQALPDQSWLVLLRDLSRHKDVERALRESEERFRVLVQNIQHLVWSARADGYIDFYNKHCLEYLNATVEDLKGWAWANYVHPEDITETIRVWTEAFTAEKESRVQFRIRRAEDGMYRWHLAHAFPYINDEGHVVRWFGTCTDIDDQKRTEEALRKAVSELQEKQAQLVQAAKLATVGEMATGIAHELNNPLNNIGLFVGNVLDYLQALPEPTSESSSAITQLKEALHQVERASAIIGHLRTFGRSSGTVHDDLSINELLQRSVSFVQEHMRLADIDLIFRAAASNPVVLGNRIQLEQVALNLLTNARDAVEGRAIRRITVQVAMGSEHVEISVSDTGSGIPPATLPRIFDPFFTTKEVGKGTGLGLAITYGIVKEHGGEITVESEVDRGTTFRVRLPLPGRRPQEA